MFSDKYPNFNKGRILKAEMLKCVRDYPRELMDIWLQEYSDGIVTGLSIRVDEHDLMVGKGIVKHRGNVYRLADKQAVPYRATGVETVIKLRFQDERVVDDYTERLADIVLDGDTQISANELELGRFKLKEGAKIRTDYRCFADFATEYNTLNLIHAHYSGLNKHTVNPMIMRYFASELLRSGTTDVYEISFAMSCLNQGMAERELILHYLARKTGTAYKDEPNTWIHKSLVRILDSMKSCGRGNAADFRSNGAQRMIID